jgi:histidine ammonia-lyase
VALEYLVGAQGLEFARPLQPGLGPRAAMRALRRTVKRLEGDRSLSPDVQRIVRLMERGILVESAETATGGLAAVTRP